MDYRANLAWEQNKGGKNYHAPKWADSRLRSLCGLESDCMGKMTFLGETLVISCDECRSLFKGESVPLPDYVASVLRSNGISRLFHATPAKNRSAILREGLLSAADLAKRDAKPTYASSDESRRMESKRGLNGYVKFGFIPRHFMIKKESEPVIFEIDANRILSMPGVKFCRTNSIRNDAIIEDISEVGKLDFKSMIECIEKQDADVWYQPKYDTDAWHNCQAEILVPGPVPPNSLRTYRE